MADNTVQVEAALLQRMVRFVKGAGTRLETMAADREQVKAAAPLVVDELVKQGLVSDEQKAAAVEALADSHERTLETLRRTAEHVAKTASAEAPAAMGAPSDDQEKVASVDNTSEARQDADRKFLAAFGFGK